MTQTPLKPRLQCIDELRQKIIDAECAGTDETQLTKMRRWLKRDILVHSRSDAAAAGNWHEVDRLNAEYYNEKGN